MNVGNRLRELREEKKLTQGDIEKRTGLVRPYISRVENNHSVPNIDTLERMARALEVPNVSTFLRWRGSAQIADPAQREIVRRNRVG